MTACTNGFYTLKQMRGNMTGIYPAEAEALLMVAGVPQPDDRKAGAKRLGHAPQNLNPLPHGRETVPSGLQERV